MPRRLSVPGGRAPQLHQPRHRTDAGQLHEPHGRAQGVLRAHPAGVHIDAVPGRGQQSGAEKLPGHASTRMRVQVGFGLGRRRRLRQPH